MQIFVATAISTLTLNVKPDDTVADCLAQALDKMGTVSEEMYLFFQGKYLKEAYTLNDYGIRENSRLNLSLRLFGGANSLLKTANFTDTSKPVTGTFSKHGHAWRVVITGLNLTGICQNKSCVASGKEVIVMKGMGVYDLYEDEHNNKCPMCKQYVNCTDIMYSRCKYSFEGTSKNAGQPKKKLKSDAPVVVDHDWMHFKEEQCGSINWVDLKITTESLTPEKTSSADSGKTSGASSSAGAAQQSTKSSSD